MSRLSTSREMMPRSLSVSTRGLTQTGLPSWVYLIPGVQRLVDRLGVTEFRRRVFHMTPALLPIGLPIIPHMDVWGPILITILLLLSATTLVLAVTLGHLFTRKDETNWMGAVAGYMIPVVSAILLFPGRAELGLMTLQILALGDGSATLGGLTLGGRRLPWNRRKTLSGLICFAVAGTLGATYSFWGEARPGVPILSALAICGVAALCAGIVESLPMRSNDNFRVGTTALLVGVAMSALLQ